MYSNLGSLLVGWGDGGRSKVAGSVHGKIEVQRRREPGEIGTIFTTLHNILQ